MPTLPMRRVGLVDCWVGCQGPSRKDRCKHGNCIGAIKAARMGVLQITATDSTEPSDSGIYSTETIDKHMTAVLNVRFAVD